MQEFEQILEDSKAVGAALRLFAEPGKRLQALQLLYQAGEHGLPIARDRGNRIQGPTVWHCSRIGNDLTRHFGTGPQHTCMWIGTVRGEDGHEFWQMRPEVRSALAMAGLA